MVLPVWRRRPRTPEEMMPLPSGPRPRPRSCPHLRYLQSRKTPLIPLVQIDDDAPSPYIRNQSVAFELPNGFDVPQISIRVAHHGERERGTSRKRNGSRVVLAS